VISDPGPEIQLEELAERVHALEHWRARHSDDIRDLQLQLEPPAKAPDLPQRDIDCEDLITWVHEHVTSIIARPLRGELKWCPRWWSHPEAILRLEALRLAWEEHVVANGAAMSQWIREHLDPCLYALTNPLGTFADCGHSERAGTPTDHRPVTNLPTLGTTESAHSAERRRPAKPIAGQ